MLIMPLRNSRANNHASEQAGSTSSHGLNDGTGMRSKRNRRNYCPQGKREIIMLTALFHT